jgi:hypothetical protein
MRPTSLLTNIGVFGGILSTALTPLFGAIVDHTPHRLHVGRISASILSVVKGVEGFVGRSTWPAVSARYRDASDATVSSPAFHFSSCSSRLQTG